MRLTKTATIAMLAAGCLAAPPAPSFSGHEMVGELASLGSEHAERRAGDNSDLAWQSVPNTKLPQSGQNSPFHATPSYPLREGDNHASSPASSPASSSASSSSSSTEHYSFAVDLSGYDGSITHYHVSYSDPQISGEVGVGHVDPTPTPAAPIIIQGVVCDRSFPGLLSGLLGLDLGLRINLALIGVGACIAL